MVLFFRPLIVLSFCLLSQLCAAEESNDANEEIRAQVSAVEAAFAKTMADRDHAGFAKFIADDAIFYAGSRALRGKDEVVAWWERFYQGENAPFSWQPEDVEILGAGDLAHSSGPVYDPNGHIIGRFASIWRHESNGWKIIFDKGSDVCNTAAD